MKLSNCSSSRNLPIANWQSICFSWLFSNDTSSDCCSERGSSRSWSSSANHWRACNSYKIIQSRSQRDRIRSILGNQPWAILRGKWCCQNGCISFDTIVLVSACIQDRSVAMVTGEIAHNLFCPYILSSLQRFGVGDSPLRKLNQFFVLDLGFWAFNNSYYVIIG